MKTPINFIKGQIMSDDIRMYLENHRFSKIPTKNLIDFCPGMFYKLGEGDLF